MISFQAIASKSEPVRGLPLAAAIERMPRLEQGAVEGEAVGWIVAGRPREDAVPAEVLQLVGRMDDSAVGSEVDVCALPGGGRLVRAHLVDIGDAISAHRYAGQAVGRAIRRFRGLRLRLGTESDDPAAIAAFVEGVRCGAFVSPLQSGTFAGGGNALLVDKRLDGASQRRAAERSAATVVARSLVEAPANVLTPSAMAQLAQAWAAAAGWSCEVLEHRGLAEAGFVATDAIGRSSEHEPCVVLLRNRPEAPVDTAIIAKGVTFDSGGISLKPAANMGKLKGDMAGAAAALCGALAAAHEGRDRSFGLVLPLAENLPDGRALRPGDVVTYADGQRVHVESTDAEGRMVLADGLLYARSAWRPQRLLTMGTLTKACIVALGNHFGALYANDDRLAEAMVAAGERAGERLWRLPVGGAYRYSLRHAVADVANASDDGGGSILAATFLQRFAGTTPWAHLDMSSFFFMDRELPWADRGYTGAGARLVAAFLAESGDGDRNHDR